jgi:Mg2+ and Co2+ transporter CorA
MSEKNIERQIENLPTDDALKVMAKAIAELQKEVAIVNSSLSELKNVFEDVKKRKDDVVKQGTD